jgi:hypothetical protein
MQNIRRHEIAVGGEAGVVDVVDMATGDPVTSLVGVCAPISSLVVTTIRTQFVSNAAIGCDPHADVGMGCHNGHAGLPTGRTTISVVSTSAGWVIA